MNSFIYFDQISAISSVMLVNLMMAGDNAIVIGMTAASVSPFYRKRVIFYGLVFATILRIVFTIIVTKLLALPGLVLAGGLLLGWISWQLWRDIRKQSKIIPKYKNESEEIGDVKVDLESYLPIRQAVWRIIVADISMSVDNVLAVAGIAQSQLWILVTGLSLSIILTGFASTIIARLLQKYHWLSYAGLIALVYVSGVMIYDGYEDLYLLLP